MKWQDLLEGGEKMAAMRFEQVQTHFSEKKKFEFKAWILVKPTM